jgi:hypothetical protein
VDVWSSGCVFYMLAQLRPAFNGQNLQNLCRSIIDDVPGTRWTRAGVDP